MPGEPPINIGDVFLCPVEVARRAAEEGIPYDDFIHLLLVHGMLHLLGYEHEEDEAAEISGELLIPFEAAKRLARQKATDDEVALRFGVSPELARWRMNSTGARIIAQRAANYRRASSN